MPEVIIMIEQFLVIFTDSSAIVLYASWQHQTPEVGMQLPPARWALHTFVTIDIQIQFFYLKKIKFANHIMWAFNLSISLHFTHIYIYIHTHITYKHIYCLFHGVTVSFCRHVESILLADVWMVLLCWNYASVSYLLPRFDCFKRTLEHQSKSRGARTHTNKNTMSMITLQL